MAELGNREGLYREQKAVGGNSENDDAEGYTEVDGITDFFKYKGKYRPRDHEVEAWGPSVGQVRAQDDGEELLNKLIYNTECTRWREALHHMISESKAEHATRQILAFLHANASSGIKALNENGYGVQIATNPAPKYIKCHDWMAVMEGLNFELTSPGSIRDIDYVDVTIGKHSDQKALEGFCHLMKSMLHMTWTNLQLLSMVIPANEGLFLFNMLHMLHAGCGIDGDCRRALEGCMVKYPHLMKCLGFINNGNKVQWANPGEGTESVCLFNTIHGLFRSAEAIKTDL